jgi:hypothetical protein
MFNVIFCYVFFILLKQRMEKYLFYISKFCVLYIFVLKRRIPDFHGWIGLSLIETTAGLPMPVSLGQSKNVTHRFPYGKK